MSDRFRALKTGPLELALDGADLRYVRFAGTEIVRRLYVAVRDEQWATPDGDARAGRGDGLRGSDRDPHRGQLPPRRDRARLDGRDRRATRAARCATACRRPRRATSPTTASGSACCSRSKGSSGQPAHWKGPQGDASALLTEQIGPQLIVGGLPQPLIGPFSAARDRRGRSRTASLPLLGRPLRARGSAQLDGRVVQDVRAAAGARLPAAGPGGPALRAGHRDRAGVDAEASGRSAARIGHGRAPGRECCRRSG